MGRFLSTEPPQKTAAAMNTAPTEKPPTPTPPNPKLPAITAEEWAVVHAAQVINDAQARVFDAILELIDVTRANMSEQARDSQDGPLALAAIGAASKVGERNLNPHDLTENLHAHIRKELALELIQSGAWRAS